jgi:uncharacterized protein with ParB-like and HNH nuclease domain
MASNNFMAMQPSNASFEELIGNGVKYLIPKFQRDYAWTLEQWEDLWADIQTLHKEHFHYMGYIVLQRKGQHDFEVIDGQQRLITLSLLILVAMRKVKDLIDTGIDVSANEERLKEITNRFIGVKDIVSLRVTSKLTLNRNNSAFYKSICSQLTPPNQRSLTATNKLLRNAFEFFLTKPMGITGEEIARFIGHFSARLMFTKIVVQDSLNAYKVFETLNARGVQLSTPDLLKNYIFSVIDQNGDVTEDTLNELDEQWSSIVSQLGIQNFTDFTRYHHNFQEKFAELKNLYFSTHNKTSKINLRNSFEKLYGVFYDINKNSNKTNQLKSWNPFDTSKPALFFDAKTMFNFSKFDIVIANPPYIDYRKIDNLTKINLGNTYKISRHSKMINIYTYFFELGLSLLSESGNLCYISPQQFLIYSNTKGLRDLIRNYSVVSFDNFSNVKVFDADTYPFISIISKKTKKTFTYKEFSSIDFDNKAKRIEIFPNPISEPVSFSKHLELINRLSKNNSKLKNYIDEIFVGTSSTPNRRNVPEKISLQFVESSNIFEYKIFNLVYYINKDEYPTESLNKQENSSLIYISRMTSRIRSVVIENSKYLAGKVNVILASNKNIYFLCALLNSNLINFWFREYFLLQHLQGGALPINSEDIMIIPYPVINEDKKIKLFDEIVKISKKNHTVELIDSQRIEYSQKIDNLIYDLFELRPSEILLIEEAMK